MKLACHLKDEQTVLFNEHKAADVADAGPPTTKLTEWFTLNAEDISTLGILSIRTFQNITLGTEGNGCVVSV